MLSSSPSDVMSSLLLSLSSVDVNRYFVIVVSVVYVVDWLLKNYKSRCFVFLRGCLRGWCGSS